MRVCERCGESFVGSKCSCGYQVHSSQHEHEDDRLTMKSGNKVPQCTWVTVERCCLPAPGRMTSQALRCQWHLYWNEMVERARTIEERIERPAFDAWWEWRETTYKTTTSWGLTKEEYWRYAHGQRIHDQAVESLPAIQDEPGYLSREEFGADLFDAIKAQSAFIQALKMMALYEAKGLAKQAQEYEVQAHIESGKLHVILQRETIAPEDLRRLLAIA